jgi:hypothetical protein
MALKEVVDELESEVYSDTESYVPSINPPKDTYASYDEVLGDDDGYPD